MSKHIWNGFNSELWSRAFPGLLQGLAETEAMVIATEKPASLESITVEFITTRAAKLGHYEKLDSPEPLTPALLHALADCESTVLRMMDRIDNEGSAQALEPLTYEQRYQAYLHHVRYWNTRLLRENITGFFSVAVPHVVFDYVIYSLCRHYGRHTAFLQHSQVAGLWFISDSIENVAPALRQENLEPVDPVVQKVWQAHVRRMRETAKPRPAYAERELIRIQNFGTEKRTIQQKLAVKRRWLRGAKWLGLQTHWPALKAEVERLSYRHEVLRRKSVRQTSYRALTVEPDLRRQFVYVPLHMQPECSTCPLGDIFVNQDLLVSLLAAVVPEDCAIYVKENIFQDHRARPARFYENLAEMRNVRLIAEEFDSFDLVDQSRAVATVTGTAGWEGLFRKKPVLVFGHHFYQWAPGAYPVRSQEEAIKAVTDILRDDYIFPAADFEKFIEKIGPASIVHELTIEGISLSPAEEETVVRAYIQKVLPWLRADQGKSQGENDFSSPRCGEEEKQMTKLTGKYI